MAETNTQQIIESLQEPFAKLLEFYGQLEISMNSIASRQLRLRKEFQTELQAIEASQKQISERLDQIERRLFENDWARRTEGSNG